MYIYIVTIEREILLEFHFQIPILNQIKSKTPHCTAHCIFEDRD